MSKEKPETRVSGKKKTADTEPLNSIMEDGFRPENGAPMAKQPVVFGSGQYATTQFPGIRHPSGNKEKTMAMFHALQGVFTDDQSVQFEPRYWHDKTFSDFSIIVDGEHSKLPEGVAKALAQVGKEKSSHQSTRG